MDGFKGKLVWRDQSGEEAFSIERVQNFLFVEGRLFGVSWEPEVTHVINLSGICEINDGDICSRQVDIRYISGLVEDIDIYPVAPYLDSGKWPEDLEEDVTPKELVIMFLKDYLNEKE